MIRSYPVICSNIWFCPKQFISDLAKSLLNRAAKEKDKDQKLLMTRIVPCHVAL